MLTTNIFPSPCLCSLSRPEKWERVGEQAPLLLTMLCALKGIEVVGEGLRRSEVAFMDFRDSTAGRQACIQGSTLAVWEYCSLFKAIGPMSPAWPDISDGQG